MKTYPLHMNNNIYEKAVAILFGNIVVCLLKWIGYIKTIIASATFMEFIFQSIQVLFFAALGGAGGVLGKRGIDWLLKRKKEKN